MTSSSAGRWKSIRYPDGRVRHDWVPADQPPAPQGQVGCWHIVMATGRQPTRWEWHADPEAARPARRAVPVAVEPPPAMPAVRPAATVEVLQDKVYRPKRSMGVGFWMAAVILAAMGGAGAVAIAHEDRAAASLVAEEKPAGGDDSDAKPTRAGLVRVADGYLNALLAGDVDDLLSYLDPACDGADPGFALAARWAQQLAAGATVEVEEVEIRGRRGSVTDFAVDADSLDGDAEDDVRRLISDQRPDGEQAFPWRFTGGEWYFKGECGSPATTDSGIGTSTVPDGGDDDAEN